MEQFDHVVVGAGIVGLSTALALARRERSVAVVESRTIASGASGGPGMRGVRGNARHLAELALAAEALRLWPGLDDDLGAPTGFERRGGVQLFDSAAVATNGGMRRLEVVRDLQTSRGVASVILDRPELERRLGPLGPEIECGILVEADGVAPQEQATTAFGVAARSAGVRITERCSVGQIIPQERGGAVVRTTYGELAARESVVVCAGVGTREVLSSLGAELPLWDVAFHAYFIEPEHPAVLDLLIGHDSRKLAAKSVPGGRMQVSGFLTAPWDRERGASLARDDFYAESERTFRSVFPAFPAGRIAVTEARLEACSPDGLQLIDRVRGTDVYFAAGWSGHGFATAPAIGPALAEWASTGIRPSILAPFAWPRP